MQIDLEYDSTIFEKMIKLVEICIHLNGPIIIWLYLNIRIMLVANILTYIF